MIKASLEDSFPELSKYIHQAALDPHLTDEGLMEICDSAKHFNFSGLCTNLLRIKQAREYLGSKGSIKLISVIAFPFGTVPSHIKQKEAELAASLGAEQLEVVPNFYTLNKEKSDVFSEELARICDIGLPVIVVLDFYRLSTDKLKLAIDASLDAGVIGIQNGNGFGTAVEDTNIRTLVELVKGRCSIKAVGGIKTLDKAIKLINAGSNHIGTSYGPSLMKELSNKIK